jgi:membrane-bound lytic murein transglycosylase D
MITTKTGRIPLPVLLTVLPVAATLLLVPQGARPTDISDNLLASLSAEPGLSPEPVFQPPDYILPEQVLEDSAAVTAADAEQDVAAPDTDIWDRMRAGFRLPSLVEPSVQDHLDIFRRHPRHVEQILRRGEPYLYYILDRVEAHGLPAELALLPMVESAFNPFAKSPTGAAGLWQFMPATARQFGLHRDWWYDDRRDITAATEAALGYLGELHQRFDGDWLLALGAYNAGHARVNRAIRHNRNSGKPLDYWHLPLPVETRDYVPKLLALKLIIENPGAYGINLPATANRAYFSIVETGGQIDLHVAASLAGVSIDEIQRLNPGCNRSITPPDRPHTLVIPAASEPVFRERLAGLSDEQRVQSIKYRIRWGDTLSTIAQYFRTTVSRLLRDNRLDSTRIVAGKVLIVPLATQAEGGDGDMQAALL